MGNYNAQYRHHICILSFLDKTSQQMEVLFGLVLLCLCACKLESMDDKTKARLCKSIEQCDIPDYAEKYLKCNLWNRKIQPADIKEQRTTDRTTDELQCTTRPSEGLLVMTSVTATLHQASKEGQLKIVQQIVSHKLEDINTLDKSGRTPIMVAALSKQREVFDYLLCCNSTLSTVDVNKDNLLQLACTWGDVEAVRKLLMKGTFDFEYRGSVGRTALMQAAGAGNLEVFDLLQQRNCSLQGKDKNGRNNLHLACLSGVANMVKHVLSLGVLSKESKDSSRMTPLEVAVKQGNKAVFFVLFQQGCKLSAETDHHSYSILHLACTGGSVDIIKYVLGHVNVNREKEDWQGWTALMTAVKYGHLDALQLLVKEGCNPLTVDSRGENILHIASKYGHMAIVKYILSNMNISLESKEITGGTPVMLAKTPEIVDLLKDKGCNLKAVNKHKWNTLHFACQSGYVDTVKYILSLNIVNIETRDNNGKTPLMLSARFGKLEVFDILSQAGANLTTVDNNRNNVLHAACEYWPRIDMVKHILSLNIVNRKQRNKDGRTPAQVAKLSGFSKLVDILTE